MGGLSFSKEKTEVDGEKGILVEGLGLGREGAGKETLIRQENTKYMYCC